MYAKLAGKMSGNEINGIFSSHFVSVSTTNVTSVRLKAKLFVNTELKPYKLKEPTITKFRQDIIALQFRFRFFHRQKRQVLIVTQYTHFYTGIEETANFYA